MPDKEIRRRAFLQLSAGLAAAGLGGCASPRPTVTRSYAPEPVPETNTFLADMYGEKPNEPYPLPAIPYEKIDPRFYRQMVADLRARIDEASAEVAVTLVSDAATEVSVLRVGRLGTFAERTLALRPGRYVVVGTRKGFRDVRHVLEVRPGAAPGPLRVRCEEPI